MKNIKKITFILDFALLLFCAAIPFITDWMLSLNDICFSLKRGIICPACGGTRCMNNFFKGNFVEAFNYNPIVFLAVFYFTIVVLAFNFEVYTNIGFFSKLRKFMLNPAVLVVLIIIYIIAGFMRNII